MDFDTTANIYSAGMEAVQAPMWLGVTGALAPLIVIAAAFIATTLRLPSRTPALSEGHTQAELEAAMREYHAAPDPLLTRLNALEASDRR